MQSFSCNFFFFNFHLDSEENKIINDKQGQFTNLQGNWIEKTEEAPEYIRVELHMS